MRDQTLTLTLRGVRGSTTSPGADTVRYGGHTTCVDIAIAPQHRLILDCGTGLRQLQKDLPLDPGDGGYRFDIFLTHFHSDHVEGLRFFAPLYDKRSQLTFHGLPSAGVGVQPALEGTMAAPWFPLGLKDTPSYKRYVDLDGANPVRIDDIVVTPGMVFHPQTTVGYRIERHGRSVAFLPDAEPGDESSRRAVRQLARDVDLLIHDAQYTPQEYDARYKSWGHSTWKHAVSVARDAGARRLVLFHHDPNRTDDQLDEILYQVRKEFPACEAAREGMTFEM